MSEDTPSYKTEDGEGFWAIVELFGHQRLVGHVTEQTIGGCAFVRVDVPGDAPGEWSFSRLLGQGAIFAINPVSEEIARQLARRWKPRPVFVYELEQLPAPPGDDEAGDDEHDDRDWPE